MRRRTDFLCTFQRVKEGEIVHNLKAFFVGFYLSSHSGYYIGHNHATDPVTEITAAHFLLFFVLCRSDTAILVSLAHQICTCTTVRALLLLGSHFNAFFKFFRDIFFLLQMDALTLLKEYKKLAFLRL